MIPRAHIISRKASKVSIGGAGGKHSEPLSEGCRGQSPLRKFEGSREHLDWLKIDLNMAEIITIQDYKHTKS